MESQIERALRLSEFIQEGACRVGHPEAAPNGTGAFGGSL